MLCSDIGYASYIRLWREKKNEYNITEVEDFNITICVANNTAKNYLLTKKPIYGIFDLVMKMSNSILRDKSKKLAREIVLLCKELQHSKVPSALINQVLRSGTSIGANIHEAQYAQGKADFISKLEISLKECSETEYWLELLYETNYLTERVYSEVLQLCGGIRKMLISSVKTVKENKLIK